MTHVDGTARVQSVSRRSNPRFWEVIHEFALLTGVPALLNTSLNNNAEPIVDSAEDAVVCFLTAGLDALVLGDYIARPKAEPLQEAYERLRPSLPHSRKLVRRTRSSGDGCATRFSIESTASRHFSEPRITISTATHAVLGGATGVATLRECCSAVGVLAPAVIGELVALWERRAVIMRP